MDTYRAIYDAACRNIYNGDVGEAVQVVLRDLNLSHYAEMAKEAARCAAAEYERPCAVFRPRIFVDGDQWCALYGDNIQDGVAGFGDSPSDAMYAFDRAWNARLNNATEADR